MPSNGLELQKKGGGDEVFMKVERLTQLHVDRCVKRASAHTLTAENQYSSSRPFLCYIRLSRKISDDNVNEFNTATPPVTNGRSR